MPRKERIVISRDVLNQCDQSGRMRVLAAEVLRRACDDIGSSSPRIRKDAELFLYSEAAQARRERWCNHAGISPHTLQAYINREIRRVRSSHGHPRELVLTDEETHRFERIRKHIDPVYPFRVHGAVDIRMKAADLYVRLRKRWGWKLSVAVASYLYGYRWKSIRRYADDRRQRPADQDRARRGA